MEVLPAKRQEEYWTERYSKGLKNQNGRYLVNLFESNNLETGHIPYRWWISKNLFLFEITNNIKIKVTQHRR